VVPCSVTLCAGDHLVESLAGGFDVEVFARVARRQSGLGAFERDAGKFGRSARYGRHLGEIAVAMEHDVATGAQRRAAAFGQRAG
jgi:hypothetical protein